MSVPCVGCGHCCSRAQCGLSLSIFQHQKVCPALHFSTQENMWRCRLVTCNAPIAEKARVYLTIGEG